MAETKVGDKAWLQAQLGILHGGLGIRDAKRHAPAAHVSSVWSCRDLCSKMDPAFDINDGGNFGRALGELKQRCLESANLTLQDGHVSLTQLPFFWTGR